MWISVEDGEANLKRKKSSDGAISHPVEWQQQPDFWQRRYKVSTCIAE